MGTSSSGREPVSAVFGLANEGCSMTTLKVPGSVLLCEVAIVWASTVEKERERVCAVLRLGGSWKCCGGRFSLAASSLARSRGSVASAARP